MRHALASFLLASLLLPQPSTATTELQESDCFAHRWTQSVIDEEIKTFGWRDQSKFESIVSTLPQKLQENPLAKTALSYWTFKTGYTFDFQTWDTIEDDTPENHFLTEDELRGLILLTKILPDFYFELPTLQSIRKLPFGTLEYGDVGLYQLKWRRWAGMTSFDGQITFAPTAVTLKDGRAIGQFFLTLVHELSHAFDRSLDIYTGFAEKPEWTQLSEWQAFQNKEWWPRNGNFVNTESGAARNPYEDFAEHLAYFILAPDEIKAATPKKFEFLSQRFFAGKKFDSETLKTEYQSRLEPLTQEQRFQAAIELRKNDYYACAIITPEFLNSLPPSSQLTPDSSN